MEVASVGLTLQLPVLAIRLQHVVVSLSDVLAAKTCDLGSSSKAKGLGMAISGGLLSSEAMLAEKL